MYQTTNIHNNPIVNILTKLLLNILKYTPTITLTLKRFSVRGTKATNNNDCL